MTKSLRNKLLAFGLLASIGGATYAWAQGQPILTTLIGTELVTVQNAGPLAPATTINTIAAFVLGSVTPAPATFTTVTANDIAGGDSSLGINGQATAQGGDVIVTGGTSATSANNGGAARLHGGLPGATGTGGDATVRGAIGGATSGNGGLASLTGGAGTAGNATGGLARAVGGAGQGSAAGGATLLTGGAGGATGAGGAITVTSGAGGATSGAAGSIDIAVGSAISANGSNVTVTAGNGAGGTNAGGNVNLVPGTAVSTGTPGEVQIAGNSNLMCGTYYFTGTPAATNQVFYIANRTMRLKSISQVHSTAAGGTSTLTVTKDTTTSAPGAGTAVMTNTFNLNATANTVQNATLSATVATVNMAAGDRLAVVFANAIQSSVGVVVTACMTPI